MLREHISRRRIQIMDLKKLIHEYLKEAHIMQVATSKDNQPWACTVYFAFDSELNLYWISSTKRRHSEELRNNEKVGGAVAIYHAPGEKVRGIQFEGVAKELTGEEAQKAMKHYTSRFEMKEERVKKIVEGSEDHLCYKITPKMFVLFDETNFPNDPRQEYEV